MTSMTFCARLLLKFLVFALPSTAINIARATMRAWHGHLPMSASIQNALARAVMTSFSPVEIQTVLPSTIETYKSWCAASPYTPDVQVLGDETTRLLWLGPRKGRHVVLFFHGGGYVMPLSPGHLDWMAHLKEDAAKHRVKLDVCILEYDLIPTHPYPRQMNQAILAFKHLLESGYSPSDIIIGGDSAGGHLALSLLSHLHRPRPKSPGIEYKIDAWHPLKGCFLVSPLASFDLSTHSFNRRFSADVLCKYTVGEWGKSLVANSPWDDEISLGLGWGMALDVPEEWWEGLDVGAHILVTGGEEEVFRDHIVQLVDVLRRRSTAGVTPYLARDEAHDGPLMNFMAGGMRGGSTGVITRWVVERFQE